LSAEPNPVSPLKRFLLAAVLCLVIGVSGGLLAAESRSPRPVGLARFTPPREAAFDFHLRDQHGRDTSLRTARGKVVVLTFLYTACQDLCPAQAAEIVDAVTRVGGKGVMVYGVSVDPVGDTPQHVRKWLAIHHLEHAPVEYLTGTRRQLERVWHAYGIVPIGATPEEAAAYAERAEYLKSGGRTQPYHPPSRPAPSAAKQAFPDTDDLAYRGRPRHAAGTQYEHSAYVMLVDPDGVQRVGFPFEQLDPARLAQDIRLLRRNS
jgi:cytochrome oxidase Cu insertion factor (SCO1/SenC/PrrC family)